jgi:mannose-6-phosphate isomerase
VLTTFLKKLFTPTHICLLYPAKDNPGKVDNMNGIPPPMGSSFKYGLMSAMFKLQPTIKDYAWGKKCHESLGAAFASTNENYEKVAEVWWGSHALGPTFLEDKSFFSGPLQNIPYLLKIISVDKPLSIQIHPDVYNAYYLHKQNPAFYPDSYPKPEMALALTPFEALCGFLPNNEIIQHLHKYPEFAYVAGFHEDDLPVFTAIQHLFSAPDDIVAEGVQQLAARLASVKEPTDKEQLVLDLMKSYPGDVGVFAPFFMNHVRLMPGEALVIPPQEIHCYLTGEAVECMAPSDNVVRAGLTSKPRDVDTLLSLVRAEYRAPIILKPREEYGHPTLEPYFTLRRFECINENIVITKQEDPTILLVVEGSGFINGETTTTKTGDSWLMIDKECVCSGHMTIIAAQPCQG